MKKLILAVFLSSIFTFSAHSNNYEENYEPIYVKVASDYLQSCNFLSSFLGERNQEGTLSQTNKRVILLRTFMQLDSKNKPQYPQILSNSFFGDLEVIIGRNNPVSNLLSKINKTETICGEIELLKMLATPSNKIDVIQTRQEITKELLAQKTIFEKVDEDLKKFKKNEASFIAYIGNEKKDAQHHSLYFKILPDECNYSPLGLEFTTVFEKFATTKNLLYSPERLLISTKDKWKDLYEKIFKGKTDVKADGSHKGRLRRAIEYIPGTKYMFSHLERPLEIDNAHFDAGMSLIDIYEFVFRVKSFVEGTSESIKIIKHLHQELVRVRSCLTAMESIAITLKDSPTIVQKLPAVAKILYVFNSLKYKSEKLKLLFELLDKNTFKTPASIFSRFGNILVAHKLLAENHDLFHEALRAIGEIDAYMSIARLYKSFENYRVKYTFVDFIDQEAPYINFTNSWNPFINPKVVVPNDIELGKEGSNRNAIITGPNAGGKSTILKLVLIDAFLGLTLGIAPAEHASMTTFDKIVPYMNPTDDTSAGNSLFMTETIRALELINTLKTGAKTLVASDEMLTGTDAIEGSAGAYSFAYNFAQYKNGIVLLATHFPYLTKLEKETDGAYANYKVSVNKVEENKISYPFKLEKGIATQHVAIDILKIKGIDTAILEKARELIEKHRSNDINLFASPVIAAA